MFFESSKELLKVIDILLQSADPEYRLIRGVSEPGNIVLVECKKMQRIYKYDERYEDFHILWQEGTVGYLILDKSGQVNATTEIDIIISLSKFVDGIIIAGNKKIVPVESIKSKLRPSSCKFVVRTDGESVILMISTRGKLGNGIDNH